VRSATAAVHDKSSNIHDNSSDHGMNPRHNNRPFKCSTHFVLDTHKLQMLGMPTAFGMGPHKFNGAVTPPLQLRAHSFLTDPRTDRAIIASHATVVVTPRGGGSGATPRGGGSGATPRGGGGGATPRGGDCTLRRGATDDEVAASLSDLRGTRVVRLSDALGVFGGWSHARSTEGFLFNTMMECNHSPTFEPAPRARTP